MAQWKQPAKSTLLTERAVVAKDEKALGIEAKKIFVAACGVELSGPYVFVTEQEANEWRHEEGNRLTQQVKDDVMTNVVTATITMENTRARRMAKKRFDDKFLYAVTEAGLPYWLAALIFGFSISGFIHTVADLLRMMI